VRIHLVAGGDLKTLCGRRKDDVVDCVDLGWYVEHQLQGTEELMVTLAKTAMVLSRLVRCVFQIYTPDPETWDFEMCDECDTCTGFYILEEYTNQYD